MGIPATTDWAKIRHAMLMVFFISSLLASTVANGLTTSGKQKRQLFREHLLPERGGKIPQDAFLLERVSLNRLNQLGVYNAEGNLAEKRHYDHPHHGNHVLPKTIKIIVPPADSRSAEPSSPYNTPPRVADTTYLIREPTILKPFVSQLSNHLPILPQRSLMLVRYFQQKRKFDSSWQKPSSDLQPEQVFAELTPYVRKLHELDGYQK